MFSEENPDLCRYMIYVIDKDVIKNDDVQRGLALPDMTMTILAESIMDAYEQAQKLYSDKKRYSIGSIFQYSNG